MLTRNPVRIPILPAPNCPDPLGALIPALLFTEHCQLIPDHGPSFFSGKLVSGDGGLDAKGRLNNQRTWSGRWESNQRPKLGKLLYCHCTTPALILLILPAIPAWEQPLILRKEDSIPMVTSAPPAVPLAPSNNIFMASRIFARSISRNATRAPHKTHRG